MNQKMLEDKLKSMIAEAEVLSIKCSNLAHELDPDLHNKMPTTAFSAAYSIRGAAREIAGGLSLLELVWDEMQKEKQK